jgi:uncharacterized membrane protein YcaP (DUF421 family)
MGNQQMSELTLFDYINSITIGSIAAELAIEREEALFRLISLVVFGLLTVLSTVLSLRSPIARRFLKGHALILMENGTLYRGSLRRARLDLDDFLTMCRKAGYFDLSQIQTALFEYNGALSILPKAANRPVTPADLGQTPTQTPIFCNLILDGQISDKALRQCGKDRQWLKKRLKEQNITSEQNVFLATYDGQDTFTAYPMVNQVHIGRGL